MANEPKTGAQGSTEAPKTGAEGATGTQTGKTGAEGAGAGKTTTGDQGGAGGTGDGKTAEGQQGQQGAEPKEKKDGTAEGAPAKKAPEKYALQVPDDAKGIVRDKHLSLIETIARENDWTNEEAQAELDERIKLAVEERNDLIKSWEDETKADKTYGGDNLPETQKLANAAIDAVFPKGHAMRDRFLQTLQGTGAAVKLEIVAFLATLGKKLGEDSPTGSRSATPGSKAGDASLMYDHPTSRALDEATRR